MNKSIYGKLAVTNLKNNRKTYLPYLVLSIISVMMFYIIKTLSMNTDIKYEAVLLCLSYAMYIMAIFSVIFLFYTNSFLIKRRRHEIGVYNILGMGKRHIAKMMAIESLITAVVSIVLGLILGVVFSKLMYLLLIRLLRYNIGIHFSVMPSAMIPTACLFVAIFMMTFVYNLLQIKLSNPIDLLHGSSQGEREPKTKFVLAILGVILLGIGYYIAQTTQNPISALGAFFIAVVCVILGTYALFIAGSIALLKMLRKNKKFYYKANHFTAVSGMIHRMKQNAVGLANICILSTMVLVMISTTVCLYVGMEDILKFRFPHEYSIEMTGESEEKEQMIRQIVEEKMKDHNVTTEGTYAYHAGAFVGEQEGAGFHLYEYAGATGGDSEVYLIPVDEYNQMEDDHVVLKDNEMIVYTTSEENYGQNVVILDDSEFHVVKELDEFCTEKKTDSRYADAYYFILKDRDMIRGYLDRVYGQSDMDPEYVAEMGQLKYSYNMDLNGSKTALREFEQAVKESLLDMVPEAYCQGRELSREDFYLLYGGFLFIGLYLGFMFLFVTVLIIYYKQISEGYEDRERYQIMQQVGMDKHEVKRSIRSQVLIVFFLPLVAAILHVVMAFKVITKLLALMNLINVSLFALCTFITILVFVAFYIIVFMLTAREYYRIVN